MRSHDVLFLHPPLYWRKRLIEAIPWYIRVDGSSGLTVDLGIRNLPGCQRDGIDGISQSDAEDEYPSPFWTDRDDSLSREAIVVPLNSR